MRSRGAKATRQCGNELLKGIWRHIILYPIGSMYRIFTYIYHKKQPFMWLNISVPWILWVLLIISCTTWFAFLFSNKPNLCSDQVWCHFVWNFRCHFVGSHLSILSVLNTEVYQVVSGPFCLLSHSDRWPKTQSFEQPQLILIVHSLLDNMLLLYLFARLCRGYIFDKLFICFSLLLYIPTIIHAITKYVSCRLHFNNN